MFLPLQTQQIFISLCLCFVISFNKNKHIKHFSIVTLKCESSYDDTKILNLNTNKINPPFNTKLEELAKSTNSKLNIPQEFRNNNKDYALIELINLLNKKDFVILQSSLSIDHITCNMCIQELLKRRLYKETDFLLNYMNEVK